ncbi:alpha/beta hydrolase fold-containing protein [Oscillochloris trichoides DG-6]|uniref:Alpha/beta hydrolase fold-containing protein n=1 Tax=Oscillochloris trichoides DG-6 TaxID=765420 RepID=E1IIM8_9CHLR|nr:alpha/beta hydrolase [Oscillochloris trichoides]EFO78978.1 alpha/beta hydrolase fold-containing protein [Oscillochloris trichoides DG-6]
MSSIPLLPGISSQMVATPRLTIHVRSSGPTTGTPVLFIHGNNSCATFWEETMLALPSGFRALAPDLRGYGDTEFQPIDATRGCRDWVDDLLGLMDTLAVERFHVVGHSLGGSVCWTLLATAPERLLSLTLAAPGSPYGFGGTKDVDGTPCWPDYAGSGAGLVNAEFARREGAGDRSEDEPKTAPRVIMNTYYWKPPFRPAREEELLSGLLSIKVRPDNHPGDKVASEHWPGIAPGRFGPNNALSPKYVGDSVERILAAANKPPILWVRGANDQIVSDASLFEIGTLGQLGVVPGWPGADAFPPQPMLSQTRRVLERYAAAGGTFRELVLAECGHTPYLEHPEEFNRALHSMLGS